MDIKQFKEEQKSRTIIEKKKEASEKKNREYQDNELVDKWNRLKTEQIEYGDGFKPKSHPNPDVTGIHLCPNCDTELIISLASRKWTCFELFLIERSILSCYNCGYEFAGERTRFR